MKKLFIFFIFALISFSLRAQNIYTVAGGNTGNGYFAGSSFYSYYSFGICVNTVAADASGNVYVSDDCNSVVYKIGPGGNLTVVAGNGTLGYSGDGGAATAAQLYMPQGVALDASGNLYIADGFNNVIREVNFSSGMISTVAGNGIAGYAGDGKAAIAGELNHPSGIRVDASGNLFIADANNNAVRKVNISGIISTVAGNGTPGYSGDGAAATSAQLGEPADVALDASGNLYIADCYNNRIRKVNTSGIISTIAGNGIQGYSSVKKPDTLAIAAELNYPTGIAVDALANLFIADGNSNIIYKVTTSDNGYIRIVAGNDTAGYRDGPDTVVELNYPNSITFDASGNLYIADQYNNRIRKMDVSGDVYSVAGNGTTGYGDGGPAVAAELQFPAGVILGASGNIYIADANNNRIHEVNTAGIMSAIAGNGIAGYTGDGGPATAAELQYPAGIARDASGDIYIADENNSAIRKVNTAGIISTIAGNGTPGYSGDGTAATTAQLSYPQGVVADAAGNLYIADASNYRIRKVNTAGIISTVAGNGIPGYAGDGEDAIAAELAFPTGVALDGSGNLYIADAYNNVIREVNLASGVISTVAGNGKAGYSGDGGMAAAAELYLPVGIVLDGSGNLFISDFYNNVVREVNVSGIISTVAGNGINGYNGDGEAATAAKLNGPACVASDASGNLFIADQNNNRIREVTKGSPLIINERSNIQDVTVYPVPNNGQFIVQIDNGGSPITNTTLSIYDVLGKEVYTQPVNAAQSNLNVNLKDGIYILRVVSDRGVVSKRIEVMR